MIFLEILGAALLLTIFGVGAWHIFSKYSKREKDDAQR